MHGCVASETPHVPKAVLLENGGEVGLGDVVGKSAVTQNNSGFACWGLGLMPLRNSECEAFDFFGGDAFGKAHHQRARTDTVNVMAGDGLRFSRHGEIQTKLEKQFKEYVLFGAVGLQMLDGGFKTLC